MRSKFFLIAVAILAFIFVMLFVYAQVHQPTIESPQLHYRPAWFAIPLHDADPVQIPEVTDVVYLYAVRAEREIREFVPSETVPTTGIGSYKRATRRGIAIIAVADGRKQELLWWADEKEEK